MAQRTTIDATKMPELRRVAEEARETNEPIVIQTNGEDIAVITPIDRQGQPHRRPPTQEQIDAVMAAAGSWKGLIDVDELKAQWRAARGSNRPPVEL
ncbi:MAG: hypothetical protein ACRDJW_19940 [Thermomicrobiales bacterium]